MIDGYHAAHDDDNDDTDDDYDDDNYDDKDYIGMNFLFVYVCSVLFFPR